MTQEKATRFTISPHRSGYYQVSIPRLTDDQEVVKALDYDALLSEVASLKASMQSIELCAHGIMPSYRDMEHLRAIIIGLDDARWTRLYAILAESRAALAGKER